jgi:hypothetical protein
MIFEELYSGIEIWNGNKLRSGLKINKFRNPD